MKTLILTVGLLFTFPVYAEDVVKVKKWDSGFYTSETMDALGAVYYAVDTIAQLCFVVRYGGDFVPVPCESIKKRQEWAKIITWK